MISKRKNVITANRAILILTAILLVIACMAGCAADAEISDRTEGSAESSFRNQMADANVTEIAVKKDLVLEAPVEVKGTKILYGEGSICAVGDGWAGDDYMIVVPSGAQLTVKGAVSINARGLSGGIHAAQGAVWTLEETASVNNACAQAANTLVEGVFRMNGGSLSGAMGHNVYNKGEVTVSEGEIIGSGASYAGIYSESTLVQDGGTIRDAHNNVAVMSGSFCFNGGNNQNSVRDGVYVAEGAELTVTSKSAVISGSGVRGIYLCGEAVIDGITLSSSGDSLVKISRTGALNLNGGTLTDSGYHSIENAGNMVMTGGTVSNSYNCGIVNTGTLEITGGSFLDNVNNKAVLNKHDGKTTISSQSVMFSGNRFAVANEDTATLDLSGAGILLSTGTNVYAYDGKVNIHDISLGASNSNNVRIYKAEVTMTNVQVLGNSASGSNTTHGVLLEGGVLNAKDVTIKNTTGYGIRNKGGHITAENLLISKSLKAGGINNSVQDHTGLPGVAEIQNLTIEEIRYNNIVVDGGTLTVTNGELLASGTNNTKITDGTLKLKDVVIHGNLPDVDGTNHAVYSTGGTLVAENVQIKDAKVTGLRVNGEKAVIRGSNVTISNCSKAGYGIDLSNGLINIDGLTMVNNYYNITTNGGQIRLSNSNLGATVSNNVRINKGGTVDLHNVVVKGHTPSHPKDVHALFVHEGKLTGEKITVSNVATVGLRVKGGTAELHGLTVEDAGGDGVWIDGGKATVYDLVIKKAGSAGVSATNTGDITVIGGSINNTVSHGAKSEGKAKLTLENITVSVSTTKDRHAVLAKGGDIQLSNIKITGLEQNTDGAGIRINENTSHVAGKDIHIADVKTGLSTSAGSAVLSGVTMEGNQYNIAVDGGNIQLLDSNLGATVSNNVRVNQGGTLDLQNVVVKGHTPDHPDSVHALFVNNGKLTGEKITVSNVATVGLRVKGGTAEIQGFTVEDAGGDGVWIDGGKATVYDLVIKKAGSAGVSATNTGDITVIGGSINNTVSHGAKSEDNAKLTLENITVSVSTTKDRHAVLAQGGDIKLNNVKITGLENNTAGAGIRVNNTNSLVEAANVVIDGAANGLSVKCGTVQISNITVKNTKAAGVSVEQGDADALVTLNNLVTENCGTHAIYTSGADAKLTVNGATLGSDGSDHVINLNGGPMVLNDVVIHDENLAAGKHALYSGAGWLTIGGEMDADIHIATNPGRVIKVDKVLTGNNLTVDWETAPTGNALEFADADMMNASKEHIALGSIQGASSVLKYEGKAATLETLEIYTSVNSWSELTALVSAMTSGSYMEYRIAGNASDWKADTSLTIPEGVQVMLSADNHAPVIEVGFDVSPFVLEGNTVLTLENLVVGGTASARAAHIIVPKDATLSLKNSTLQYFEGSCGGAVHVNCGTLSADGATFANNSNSNNWGGAIGIWGGTVNISNSLFTGNTSKNSGGAIINYKADGGSQGGTTDNTVGNLTLTDCVFTKNTNKEHGGAIASWANGTTTITGCVFGDESDVAMGNSVTKNGGAIHVQDGHQMTVTNCKFFYNSAAVDGGAIFTQSAKKLDVTDSTFKGNVATKNGGAILVGKTAEVRNASFTENSGYEGGAISVTTGSTLNLHDVVCADNTTTRALDLSTYGYGDIRVADNKSAGAVALSGKIVATIWNNQAHAVKVVGALTADSNVIIDWRLAKLAANHVGILFSSEEIMNASKQYITLGIDASTTEGWELRYSAVAP